MKRQLLKRRKISVDIKILLKTGFLCLFAGLMSLQVVAQQGQQSQQGIRISGSVHDENNEFLGGINVSIFGNPAQGTMTDDKGEYSLIVPNDTTVLVFSSVGYQTVEVPVGKRRIITVTLKEEVAEIGQVTIVAFGKQKKESVIGSIETVKASDLVIPGSNLTAAFAGRIPGIISYQTSGEPGNDNAQFFVRGITTFGVNKDPLILIDGFEASSDELARMQPDDIESFSVLKDAMATVLYGARGANGIVMVTTKTGTEGATKVSARVDVHVATPTRMLELLDGVEYMRLYNQARLSRYPRLSTFYSEQKIQATELGLNPMIFPNINWYDQLFNNGTTNTKANVNISGGGKIATFFVAGGFDHETGLLKVDKLNNFNSNISINRFHIRSNVIIKLTPTTTLDTRIQGLFQKYNGPNTPAGDIYGMVMNANPVDFPAVYEPDPEHLHTNHILFGSTDVAGSNKANPYAEMVRGYRQRDESTITAQASLSQKLDFLTKGLIFQAKVSVNAASESSGTRSYNPFYYSLETYNMITGDYTLYNLNPTNPNARLGDVNPSRNGSAKYYFEARLNWGRQFGKHSVGLMTVATAEDNVLTTGSSTNIYETLPERNLGNSGRVTYDFDSRYFAEFSYGYNGSEKFIGDKQFGFFPSVGVAWLVSNEKFWIGGDILSQMKLKFTWGRVGNDAIAGRSGRFFYLSHISAGGSDYYWGSTFDEHYSGYSIHRYANPDISWEESTKYNLGIELGFLKNEALKIQADIFYDIRDKIYWPRENFPATSGFEMTISGNTGKVISRGMDASIDLQHHFSNDFWMTGRVNFTFATNEIVEIDEKNYLDDYLKRKGQHTNQQMGFVAERLFIDELEIKNSPSQTAFGTYQAGDIKYLDINKDGEINDNDRIPIGYPTIPAIQYGFGLSSGYKKVDFSFFFQGNGRTSFFIDPAGIAPFVSRRNAPVIVARGSWTESHPDVHAFWPRLSPDPIDNNTKLSTWWLREGSFVRLKTIELGYNLPAAQKVFLQSSRIYLSVENAFYFSSFKLWDPEVGGNGLGYPLNRRFNIGLQLNF
ncbi:MAG: TonB-dependent receptor [Prevotellaceae bacterium]|jgi:TonB-linked SusC/RagA family outer membrane protein|nr:TonB-dependent receptor [Prevotellaceae bacterium]